MAQIHFTKEQIVYLMEKLGAQDPDEAIEVFSRIVNLENVDPLKMPLYLRKLMEKDGAK